MLSRCGVLIFAIIFVASGNAYYRQYERPESCSIKRARGAAVTCDENGLFTEKQCNITSGTCWCVLPSSGWKIPGKTSADASTLDCSDVTPCQRLFQRSDPLSKDSRPPNCRDEDGHFAPMQCQPLIPCYCVVPESGMVIPGLQNLHHHLDAWPLSRRERQSQYCNDSCPMKRERHASVQCDSDGLFAAKQCDVTSGSCGCVVPHTGRYIPGSERADGDMLSCSGDDLTPCEKAFQEYANAVPGKTYVKCSKRDGHFQVAQCRRYWGMILCTCVVPETGNEIPGLYQPNYRPYPCKNSCPWKRRRGAGVSCDEKGWYSLKQCDDRSGTCWCVVPQTGDEIPGTKTAEGTALNCSAVEKPCQKEYIRYHVAQYEYQGWGRGQNRCRGDGHYHSTRCGLGTPKDCKCYVPETGLELPGRGPSVDCDNLRPCQLMWRNASLRLPSRKRFPALTMCDDDGNFDSVRCDFDNSTCWCAAPDTGEKVPGSPVVAFASWRDDEAEVRRRLSCAVPKCPGDKIFDWIPANKCEVRCEDLGRRPSCGWGQYPRGKCVCPPGAPFADGDSCLTRSRCLAMRSSTSDAK